MLSDVAKGFAQRWTQIVAVHQGIQAVTDPGGEEAKEDVEKETDGELPEEFWTIVLQQTVDNEGDEEEAGWDENENRIKLLRVLSVLQLLLR